MKTPLTPQEADRVFDLVAEASALEPEQRAAFLAQACAGVDPLRAEVESLLDFKTKAPDFLASPAFERGVELLGFSAGDDLKPGDTLGEYRVVSLLGSGGMGEVYLADDAVHGRQVALKLIGQGRAEEVRGRHFRHERKVLATLNHPHIARLYGSGVTDKGQAYLVMEYVEGERLDRYCQNGGLDIPERLALFRKVCAAVSYAHQNLVVHRDLKPANIRVTPEGEPKLLDFGIAKLLDPEGTTARLDPTVTMQGAMTPEYASPEQIKGEPITTASDVYSLGVVLFELLTGQRPFAHLRSRRPDELARAICEEEPPRPSTVAGRSTQTSPTASSTLTKPTARLRQRLAGDLDNIVAKALPKEPARRYASVAALSEDVRRHGEGLPIRARKDTFSYRAGKFIRRHKAGVAAALLLTLALVGGLVATAWQAHVADQERDRARQERDRARVALTSAETARKQTQQINDFLQTLLGSASPRKMGKDVKVIQVLDAAGTDVDRTLANEPEVLAEIHRTLGITYSGLSMLPAAETHHRAALALFQRLHGAEDPRTVEEEGFIAQVIANENNHAEAVRLWTDVARWLRQHPDGDQIAIGRTRSNQSSLVVALIGLSFSEAEQGRLPEAQQVMEEAMAVVVKTSGENSAGYASALGQLAILKQKENDLDAAIELLRRERAILSKIAPDQTDIVVAEVNECLFLLILKRYAEAGTLMETTRRDCHRILGEGNNVIYYWVQFLSEYVDFHKGDFEKVAGGGKEILDHLLALMPANDGSMVMANFVLGASLTRVGRASEGEPYLRAALTSLDPDDPADFRSYDTVETTLGECLLAQKRYAEAEPFLLTGYDKSKQKYGPSSPEAARAAACLHDLYLAWNKPEQAARFANNATAKPSPTP